MSAGPRLVIGLTGLPSSGKGEVAAALRSAAEARGWRAAHLSFSDEIKAEAMRRGYAEEAFDRDLLSRVATELRSAEGTGVLARRLVERIAAWRQPVPELFVVEALRHPGEADALRDRFGGRFVLVAVIAEFPVITRRLIQRARADESRAALRSEADAVRLLRRELNGRDAAEAPDVGRTIARADARIENNGTLEELRKRVSEFFEGLAAKASRGGARSRGVV